MKICKDCKHYFVRKSDDLALCMVTPASVSLVDGAKKYWDCTTHRTKSTLFNNFWCGKDARYFQEKVDDKQNRTTN